MGFDTLSSKNPNLGSVLLVNVDWNSNLREGLLAAMVNKGIVSVNYSTKWHCISHFAQFCLFSSVFVIFCPILPIFVSFRPTLAGFSTFAYFHLCAVYFGRFRSLLLSFSRFCLFSSVFTQFRLFSSVFPHFLPNFAGFRWF